MHLVLKYARSLLLLGLLNASSSSLAAAEPLKVFILAGQSNMEGHAKIDTFNYIGDDPETAPLLAKMQTANGQPRTCDGVWISYLTGGGDNLGEGFGKLTAGYGSRRNPTEDGGKIGPEFTFGIAMDEAYDEPVLIIKTAWGGKSLFYDFRPPSSGPYERSAQDVERDRYGPEGCGHYYRLMIDHVQQVLSDIGRVCPEYDPQAGFEIAGFVWFQGWNDMVNRNVYPIPPPDSDLVRYADYSRWLADFIRDVRSDLKVSELPFVIGVMGVGGREPNEHVAAFRAAMAAAANDESLNGNVSVVQTADFWDEPLSLIQAKYDKVSQMAYFLRTENKNYANKDGTMSKEQQQAYLKEFESTLITKEEAELRRRGASNAAYHYLGCAKTFALMGVGFAEELYRLRQAQGKE